MAALLNLDEYRERLAEILQYLPPDQREAAIEAALLCFAEDLRKKGHDELANKLIKHINQ